MRKVKKIHVSLKILLSLVLICMFTEVGLSKDYNISDFGAIGDGKFLCSKSIQKAIDECSASGGGVVLVPGGTFLTGTILLKDNVELHLAKDAVLLGSVNHPQDYEAGRGIIAVSYTH